MWLHLKNRTFSKKFRNEQSEAQRWLVPGAGNKSATLSLRRTESEQGAQGGAEEGEKPTVRAPERAKINTLRNPRPWAAPLHTHILRY